MGAQWTPRITRSLVDRPHTAHCFRTCLCGSRRASVAVAEAMRMAAAVSAEAQVGPVGVAVGVMAMA